MPPEGSGETRRAADLRGLMGGRAKRLLAYLLDTLLLSPLLIAAVVLLQRNAVLGMISMSLAYLAYLVYFSYMEWRYGSTIGKRALGLVVLRADDLGPISMEQAVLRNLFRQADGALLALPLLTRDGRRIGDGAAGTFVADASKAELRVPTLRAYEGMVGTPPFHRSEDKAVVRALAEELSEHPPGLGDEVIRSLAVRLARGGDPESVVRRAVDLFGWPRVDERAALLTYAALSGAIRFRRETRWERTERIYRRAAELAYDLDARRSLSARASLVGGMRAYRGDRRLSLGGAARYLRGAPRAFRRFSIDFGLAALVLLMSAAAGTSGLGAGFVDLLRDILGPLGEVEAPPPVLAFLIYLNNLRVSLTSLSMGPAVYPILLLLGVNGFVIGAFAAHFAVGGASAVPYLAPHGFLEVSSILLASAGSIRMARHALMPPRGSSRYEALRRDAPDALSLAVAAAAWLAPAALVEAFVTEGLASSNPTAAVTLGLILTIPFYAWLALGGRSKSDETVGEGAQGSQV